MMKRLLPAVRLLLAVLLLWAAVTKIANPTDFLGSVLAYQLPLPRIVLQLTAIILPWFELMCGLLLLANVWVDSALVCAAGLLAVFLVVTGQAWIRGLDISCGCFDPKFLGLDKRFPGAIRFVESVAFAFVRNLALAAMTFFLLRQAFERSPEREPIAVAGGKKGKSRPRR